MSFARKEAAMIGEIALLAYCTYNIYWVVGESAAVVFGGLAVWMMGDANERLKNRSPVWPQEAHRYRQWMIFMAAYGTALLCMLIIMGFFIVGLIQML